MHRKVTKMSNYVVHRIILLVYATVQEEGQVQFAHSKKREKEMGGLEARPARKVMGANGAGDKEGLVEIQNQVEGAVSSSTTQRKPCDKKQKNKIPEEVLTSEKAAARSSTCGKEVSQKTNKTSQEYHCTAFGRQQCG